MAEKIAFKGTINGIILQFDPNLSFEELYSAIEDKLKQANRFFEGSNIIGIEGGSFNEDEEIKLAHLFRHKGGMKLLSLEQVERIKPHTTVSKEKGEESSSVSQVSNAVTSKEEIPLASPKLEEKKSSFEDVEPAVPSHSKVLGETIFHRGTLRSGSVLNASGHIVLLGDANPGSELIAKGNILVFGALRGFVHAGSTGDESAYIVANKLQPTQLRIATHITRPPDDVEETTYTEIASVKDGQIIIEPYK